MRTLDTLIQQALMMQDLDRAAGDTVMVKGWYADLLPEEKELFDNWLLSMVELLEQTFGGFQERLVELGEKATKAFAEAFKNPT